MREIITDYYNITSAREKLSIRLYAQKRTRCTVICCHSHIDIEEYIKYGSNLSQITKMSVCYSIIIYMRNDMRRGMEAFILSSKKLNPSKLGS